MREDKNAPRQSLGDIIDKLCILLRKLQFGEHDAYKELEYLIQGLNKMGYSGGFIATIIQLAQSNFEIWNRENDFRKGVGMDTYSLEEIGRMAIQVREFNRKRIKAKNEINRLSEKGFREFKVNHLSQC